MTRDIVGPNYRSTLIEFLTEHITEPATIAIRKEFLSLIETNNTYYPAWMQVDGFRYGKWCVTLRPGRKIKREEFSYFSSSTPDLHESLKDVWEELDSRYLALVEDTNLIKQALSTILVRALTEETVRDILPDQVLNLTAEGRRLIRAYVRKRIPAFAFEDFDEEAAILTWGRSPIEAYKRNQAKFIYHMSLRLLCGT